MYVALVIIDYVSMNGNIISTYINSKDNRPIVIDSALNIDCSYKIKENLDIGNIRIYNFNDEYYNISVYKSKIKTKHTENIIELEFFHKNISFLPAFPYTVGYYNIIFEKNFSLSKFSVSGYDPRIFWDNKTHSHVITTEIKNESSHVDLHIKASLSNINFHPEPSIIYEKCNNLSNDERFMPMYDGVFPNNNTLKKIFKSIILQPNIAGIGIDLKKMFKIIFSSKKST